MYVMSKWIVLIVWLLVCYCLEQLIEKWKKASPNAKILPNVCSFVLGLLFLWQAYRIIAEKIIMFYVNV